MTTEYHSRPRQCACGREFEPINRHQRSCPGCIEIKKAVNSIRPRPLRNCKRCGAESRECQYGLCPPCWATAEVVRKAWVAESREARKRDRAERRKKVRTVGYTDPLDKSRDLSHLANGAITVEYKVIVGAA